MKRRHKLFTLILKAKRFDFDFFHALLLCKYKFIFKFSVIIIS